MISKIAGVGVDIEDVKRFSRLSFKKNKSFYQKIFTKKEIEYCLKMKDPYKHFAARFCAKEAFIKAVGKRVADFLQIEVLLEEGNIPKIKCGEIKSLLSLAHENNKAIAFVVIGE